MKPRRVLIGVLLGLALLGCAVVEAPDAPVAHNAIAAIPSRDHPTCLITRIVDGDTVEMRCDGNQGNIRLTGYDTPETYRPRCQEEARLGHRASRHLETLLRNARIIAPEYQGVDRYRRALVGLTLDGQPLSRSMIEAGYAVPYDGGRRIDWCDRLRRL